MSNFLLQKRPDGESKWADQEGRSCHFAQRLPNAKILRKNDRVLFDRPLKCGTSEGGCIYDQAIVARLIAGDDGHVDAHLTDFVGFLRPVRLIEVGDPRLNAQHSFQPVPFAFYQAALALAGGHEGVAP